MNWVKSLIIAFSMYSKIPMPHLNLEEKDMRYVMGFFPLVGLVLGACQFIWYKLSVFLGVPNVSRALIFLVLPVIVTGGINVDGYMDTSSYINTKSISKDGGISTFRSSVVVAKNAKNAKSSVSCQSLMLDAISRSDTIPAMDIRTKDANVGHEAQIGSISDEAVFYLMSRGMSEEDARACIVSGFADNVSKELPLEYAVEMNNLIRLEMKGSIG